MAQQNQQSAQQGQPQSQQASAAQAPAAKKSLLQQWYAKNFMDSQLWTVIGGLLLLGIILLIIKLT